MRASISSKMRGSVKSSAAKIAPASISVRRIERRRHADDREPGGDGGANARERILEGDRMRRAARRCARARSDRARDRASSARSSAPITRIGRRCVDAQRRQNLFGVGARRVGDDRALQPAPIGESRAARRAPAIGSTSPETVAIGRLLGVEGRGLLVRRQVREVAPRDHGVGGAHDVGGVFQRDRAQFRAAQRRAGTRRRCSASLSTSVPSRSNRSAVFMRPAKPRAGRHIVAPICQGANSASP